MKAQWSLALAALVCACSTTASNAGSVPTLGEISIPEEHEAQALTIKYVDIMEHKLPILDQIAIVSARDRYSRDVFIDMFSSPDMDPDVRTRFQKSAGAYVELLDQFNTNELKTALESTTWREIVEGEPFLFERVFSVVQHSNDKQFRSEVLVELEPLVQEGLVPGNLYATMYDKNEIAFGRDQRYGTQYKCFDGSYQAYDLGDPGGVDTRRKQVGLGPISAYLKEALDYYGPCGS